MHDSHPVRPAYNANFSFHSAETDERSEKIQ